MEKNEILAVLAVIVGILLLVLGMVSIINPRTLWIITGGVLTVLGIVLMYKKVLKSLQ